MAVASKVTFEIDGEFWFCGANLSVQPDDTDITSETGLSGIVGYSEAAVPYAIEGEFFLLKGGDITKVTNTRSASILVEDENHSFVMAKSWKAGTVNLDMANKRFTAKFESNKLTPVVK